MLAVKLIRVWTTFASSWDRLCCTLPQTRPWVSQKGRRITPYELQILHRAWARPDQGRQDSTKNTMRSTQQTMGALAPRSVPGYIQSRWCTWKSTSLWKDREAQPLIEFHQRLWTYSVLHVHNGPFPIFSWWNRSLLSEPVIPRNRRLPLPKLFKRA